MSNQNEVAINILKNILRNIDRDMEDYQSIIDDDEYDEDEDLRSNGALEALYNVKSLVEIRLEELTDEG